MGDNFRCIGNVMYSHKTMSVLPVAVKQKYLNFSNSSALLVHYIRKQCAVVQVGTVQEFEYTVLPRASIHDRSQLKHYKFGVGGCMEKVLEQFNYPCASALLGFDMSQCIVTSPVLRFYLGQHSSVESCIVLETCSLVSKAPRSSSLLVWNVTDEAMTGVCKPCC